MTTAADPHIVSRNRLPRRWGPFGAPLPAFVFLSPILGWISVIAVLWAAIARSADLGSTLRLIRTERAARAMACVLIGFLVVILASEWLHDVDGSWWRNLRFAIPTLVPLLLVRHLRQADYDLCDVGRWAAASVAIACCVLAVEASVHFLFVGGSEHYRARALSANSLFVSAMLTPMIYLQWLGVGHGDAGRFARSLVLSVAGLLCLAVLLNARMSVIIVVALVPMLVLYLRAARVRVRIGVGFGLFLVFAVAAVLVVTALSQPAFVARLAGLIDYLRNPSLEGVGDESTRLRLAHWSAAARAIAEQPWLGYGFRNEQAVLAAFQPPGAALVTTSHQQYLSFTLWAGVPGLIVGVAYLLLPLVVYAARVGRRSVHALYAALALTLPIILNGLADTVFDDLRLLSYYTVLTLFVHYAREAPSGPSSHGAAIP